MKIGLSLLVAALVVAAIALFCWNRGATVPAARAPESAVERPGSESVRAPESPRQEVATAAPEAGPNTTPRVPGVTVDPWIARLRIVDESHRPVPDASITLWLPKLERSEGSPPKNGYSLEERTQFLDLRADAEGRAAVKLERECVVAIARKEELGESRAIFLWCTKAASTETELVLETKIELRGVVLRADLSRARGATVGAKVGALAGPLPGEVVAPAAVTTDADGRFRIALQRGGAYRVQAELDGESTYAESIVTIRDPLPEMVLVFPGAYTLAGSVVDAHGVPVPDAEVTAWRAWHQPEPGAAIEEEENVSGKCAPDGTFSMGVRTTARYQVHAVAKGHANSDLVWMETSATTPHAEARLVLRDLAEIRGRVVHGDGSAFPGVRVGAKAETGDDSGNVSVPSREEQFGAVAGATADADGAFALRVHPGTTWTLTAYPNAPDVRIRATLTGVAPGRTDVALVVSDAVLAGCVVHGTVSRSDGQPLGPFAVEFVEYRDGVPRFIWPVTAAIDGVQFTCPPMTLGGEFAVRVFAAEGESPSAVSSSLAPAYVGPFRAESARVDLDFRLEPWGRLPVRVLDSGGTAAQRVVVGAEPKAYGVPPVAQPVDAVGCAELRCAPGAHRLTVVRDADVLYEQEVTVLSGANTEVIVRLPAAPGNASGR